MYEFFSGKLTETHPTHLILDVHGVGYKILTPVSLYGKLPHIGSDFKLYTSFIVRELSQTLFGFATHKERDFFEVLITVSGIGPKTALAIIGHFELTALEASIQNGNTLALSKVPGIGKKTAERLIVDLRGRIASSEATLPGDHIQDALNALLNLGYSQALAEKAVRKASATLPPQSDLSTLITAALKN